VREERAGMFVCQRGIGRAEAAGEEGLSGVSGSETAVFGRVAVLFSLPETRDLLCVQRRPGGAGPRSV
jgi:hypothetical protein